MNTHSALSVMTSLMTSTAFTATINFDDFTCGSK